MQSKTTVWYHFLITGMPTGSYPVAQADLELLLLALNSLLELEARATMTSL